jgi:hypothetical protein
MLQNLDVSNINPILLLTPQHAGTYFWEDFLSKHPDVSLCARLERPETNIKYINRVRRDFRTASDKGKTVTFHSHIFDSGHLMMLMAFFPTFLSLRDPLLCLITLQARHPNLIEEQTGVDYGQRLIEKYAVLVETINQLGEPDLVIPIDLVSHQNQSQKASQLNRLLELCDISGHPIVSQYAAKWPIVRSIDRGGAPGLKEAYAKGDRATIQAGLPTASWGALQTHKNVLQPYLEKHGYKNLLWW